jgi:hypothetical protein
MQINIEQLTEAELIELNHRIVERLRFLQQMRAHERMLDFAIGARVMFTADRGEAIAGILTRYNKKTVTVITDSGQQWNVAPGVLHKVPVAEEASKAPNVIELKPK